MKIVSIVGARPQFIKASALSRRLLDYEQIEEVMVHTGQHFDANMSAVFFDELGIPEPRYNLGIHSMHHGEMTGKMLAKIEEILLQEKPDLVLTYGDTNSTLAGALAAKKLKIKLAHVEAGLRSFDMTMPEELNRILTDRISDFLFCPTQVAVKNLEKEGFDEFDCKVILAGDIMYDSALYALKQETESSEFVQATIEKGNFILCTFHRAENTDDLNKLSRLVAGLNKVNQKYRLLIPLHPRSKALIKKAGIRLDAEIIEPLGYAAMLKLLKASDLLITDSGGLQKEAYFVQKKCLTLRDHTEWVELLDIGVNELCPIEEDSIFNKVEHMLAKEVSFSKNLYGDGDAAGKIIKGLLASEEL